MLTAIFIDGGYLDSNANANIDYVRISNTLAGEDRILQTRKKKRELWRDGVAIIGKVMVYTDMPKRG